MTLSSSNSSELYPPGDLSLSADLRPTTFLYPPISYLLNTKRERGVKSRWHTAFPLASSLLCNHYCRTTTTTPIIPAGLIHHFSTISRPHFSTSSSVTPFSIRFFSTSRSHCPNRPDIGARARQLQTRRFWMYALTFGCIAGFIVIVLNQFQDQLVFYVTPSDALSEYQSNPIKNKFRLGGLVLDGSVTQVPSSPEMEFVITDLITDILVKYEGSLPDLFREGHSVVVEGFIKPFTEEMKEEESILGKRNLEVTRKARTGDCYFAAGEVLAKHDEKYMPKEVAEALEKNKKIVQQEEEERAVAAAPVATSAGLTTTVGAA